MTETISIFGPEEGDDRLFGRQSGRPMVRTEIAASELAAKMQSFLRGMSEVLGNASREAGEYELSEVTVKAEVSAKGTVSIFGSGGEVGGTGGLEFKFVRRDR